MPDCSSLAFSTDHLLAYITKSSRSINEAFTYVILKSELARAMLHFSAISG